MWLSNCIWDRSLNSAILKGIFLWLVRSRVETKHRIARNLARIARKFTRSTKIEIEMLEKKFARFLLGSKEDRKFYARDRSDRNSMLEMIARKLQLKLDKERLKIFALFEFGNWDKYVVFIHFSKLIRNYSNSLKYFIEDGVDSRFSYIMLEKWLFLLEKCSVLLENFFRT